MDGVHPQEGPRDRDAFKARGITFVSPLGFKFVFFAIKGCPRKYRDFVRESYPDDQGLAYPTL